MPYRCVHCSSTYNDGSSEIIKGCSGCGSKFFFYIKPEKLKEIEAAGTYEEDLSDKEKKQIEKDVREIAGISSEEMPIFLDFESIKIVKPGKYLIDIQKIFQDNKPKIYQLEDGKYVVDLSGILRKK